MVKTEFVLGLLSLVAEALGSTRIPHVQERMGEVIVYLETMQALLRAAEADSASARDRARLFHLAWDVACSAFGGRQVLYERFFGGDPERVSDRKLLLNRCKKPFRRPAFPPHRQPGR